MVVGFASPSPIDMGRGVMCEVRRDEETEPVALAVLELGEDDPNCRYVDDYEYWLRGCPRYWPLISRRMTRTAVIGRRGYDDDEDERTAMGRRRGGLSLRERGQLGRALPAARDEYPAPGADSSRQPPTGRNDPCPCGSGKKFKKCCLRKQGDGGR